MTWPTRRAIGTELVPLASCPGVSIANVVLECGHKLNLRAGLERREAYECRACSVTGEAGSTAPVADPVSGMGG